MTGDGSGVRRLGAPVPLFPWPESAPDLLAEAVGQPALYAPAPSPPRVVTASATTAWTAALLHALESAAPKDRTVRLEVTRNAMTEHTAALGGAPLTADGAGRAYDLALGPPDAAPATLEALRALPAVRVGLPPCAVLTVRTDGVGPLPQQVVLPQTPAWVADVRVWPHLLWLLQGAPALLRARRRGRWSQGGNVLGRKVRIHRTALVEDCVLADGVEVEAHATLMGCALGEGVRVADHAAVHHSVVGAGVQVLADTYVRRVVALPGSTVSNLDLRESVLGRQMFITAGVIFFTGMPGVTAPFGQSPDALQDSGHPELGCAVGHRCVLGTRAIMEPGRALPGGTVIVMRPEEGVMHTPGDLPPFTPVAWDAAGLTAVAARWPGHRPPELE